MRKETEVRLERQRVAKEKAEAAAQKQEQESAREADAFDYAAARARLEAKYGLFTVQDSPPLRRDERGGRDRHPDLPDVGLAIATVDDRPGRMIWYPAGDINAAEIVIEAVRPSTISIGSGSGAAIEIQAFDANIAIAMIRDQERWLRYGDRRQTPTQPKP